jgi:ketosteroid isomerase-like protein
VSAENVEVVRRLLEAWNKGEDVVGLGLIAEDVEYVNPPDAMEPGTRHGQEGWNRAFSMVRESYDEAHVEIERVVEVDDARVLILATMHVQGRGSQVPVAAEQSYLWTLRDGQAIRFEWFWGHEAGLEAAGLDG